LFLENICSHGSHIDSKNASIQVRDILAYLSKYSKVYWLFLTCFRRFELYICMYTSSLYFSNYWSPGETILTLILCDDIHVINIRQVYASNNMPLLEVSDAITKLSVYVFVYNPHKISIYHLFWNRLSWRDNIVENRIVSENLTTTIVKDKKLKEYDYVKC
jgi:hypothetical protein